MYSWFTHYCDAAANLLFPRDCLACQGVLLRLEKDLCTYCLATLPYTNDHLTHDNATLEKFLGRVPVNKASALYYFSKKGQVQQLLHAIKYRNRPQLAYRLGYHYGGLLTLKYYEHLDLVLPVPLHPDRLNQRTYNQSAYFGRGLAKAYAIPCEETLLLRTLPTETQTGKTRLERWHNVRHAFYLPFPDQLQGKHLLLVDDLITTGATIEACVHTLWQAQPASIAVASIAVAL